MHPVLGLARVGHVDLERAVVAQHDHGGLLCRPTGGSLSVIGSLVVVVKLLLVVVDVQVVELVSLLI